MCCPLHSQCSPACCSAIPRCILTSYRRPNPRRRCLENLVHPQQSLPTDVSVAGGLWNCRSAVQKAEFITAHAGLRSLQFLALTETWISPHNTATPAALSVGYSFSHTPRTSGRGGGTGLLLSPSWTFSLSSLNTLSTNCFEFHAVIVSHPIKLFIVVLYRPPGPLGLFLDELDILLTSIPEDGTPVTLLGDFNLKSESPQMDSVVSLLQSFGFNLSPSPPTHKAGNQLDLVFSRSCLTPQLTVTPLHVSDHFFISFPLFLSPTPTPSKEPPTVSFRQKLHTLSHSSFTSSVLSSLPSLSSFTTMSPGHATSILNSTLTNSLDKLCPFVSKQARPSPPCPWLTDSLRADRALLRAAERKWRKTASPKDLAKYHSLLSSFTVVTTSAKSKYFRSQIESCTSNPRKLFSTFSSLLTPPPPPPSSSLSADDFKVHFEEKVAGIRDSFAATATSFAAPSELGDQLASFEPLEDSEVGRLITAHRATTCPLDPIPATLLQAISGELLPYLSSIINTSLTSGVVPSDFKLAQVTPLLKKPTLDSSNVNNFRPVSLLSFLSKTLERAVLKQLSPFLIRNNLLDPHQSGFKAEHSTETALLAVTEALNKARASDLSSALILLDLSAAFDTVNHQLLLSTLAEMGIAGTALSWFRSYLAGRSFQVRWNGSTSAPCPLTTGVPQGSVLGPLLFSIYTRSLGSVIEAHGFSYHCYADDTQLLFSFPPSHPRVSERIAACLSDISSWMSTHHLKLNPGKTELLFIPAKSSLTRELSITIDGVVVTASHSVRSLGVTLDDNLDFRKHIARTTQSCRYMLRNIKRIRPFLTEHSTQLLVQATVLSRLDYCNSLLAGLPANAINPLQIIQNSAARMVFNQPRHSHTTPLLRSLHWLPVAARIKHKTLTLAFAAANRMGPAYLQDMIRSYVPTRALRSATSGRLVNPAPNKGPRRPSLRCFSHLAPHWWNDLPAQLRTSLSKRSFRRGLKTHLFKIYLN